MPICGERAPVHHRAAAAIASASSWSWVTMMKVMPTFCCSWVSSERICLAQLGVECRKRLVEQENLRLFDQRAGQGDTLALAARQLVRHARAEVDRVDQCEGFLDAPVALGLRNPFDLQAVADVVGDLICGKTA